MQRHACWILKSIEQVGATLIMEGLEYVLHLRVQRAAQAREAAQTGDGDDGALTSGSAGGRTAVAVRDDAAAP